MKYVCPYCGEASADTSWGRDEVELTREQDVEPVRIIVQRTCPGCETPSEETALEIDAVDE